MNILYLDCFSGISGDMFLGMLIDLGLSPKVLHREWKKIKMEEFKCTVKKVYKGAIQATQVQFHLSSKHDHDHENRSLKEINALIDQSGLNQWVKEKSKAVFLKLGEAEAKVHGVPIDKIHFHEVGAQDAILDIVGVCIGLEALGIEKIYASSIFVGRGMAHSEHGAIPIPGPATLELLKGFSIREGDVEEELTTPTGAALLAAFAEVSPHKMPEMIVTAVGYGAGQKDFALPNVLRGLRGNLGTKETATLKEFSPWETESVELLTTNIDDLAPEIYDYLMQRLFKEGAQDVFFTPIQMKKNRPAVKVEVLTASGKGASIAEVLFRETGTLGIRIQKLDKFKLQREISLIETSWGKVTVKIARLGKEIVSAKPEYEECKKISQKNKVPLREVYQQINFKLFTTSRRRPRP